MIICDVIYDLFFYLWCDLWSVFYLWCDLWSIYTWSVYHTPKSLFVSAYTTSIKCFPYFCSYANLMPSNCSHVRVQRISIRTSLSVPTHTFYINFNACFRRVLHIKNTFYVIFMLFLGVFLYFMSYYAFFTNSFHRLLEGQCIQLKTNHKNTS